MKNLLLVIVAFFLIGLPFNAYAVRQIVFRKTTSVYEKASKDSNVLMVFEKSERAPISSKDYGQWKKIVVEIDGVEKIGWILAEDAAGAKIIERSDPYSYDYYHLNKWSIGVLGSFNFMSQGGRAVSVQGAPPINVSSLSGSSIYFGILGDYFINSHTAIRGEFLLRSSHRTGDGAFDGGTNASIQFDQAYTSIGAMIRFYGQGESNLWWGVGLEAAKLTQSKLTYQTVTPFGMGDQIATTEGIKFPTFIVVTAAFGYDFHLTKKIFLIPELKAGVLANSSPIVISVDLTVPVVYTF